MGSQYNDMSIICRTCTLASGDHEHSVSQVEELRAEVGSLSAAAVVQAAESAALRAEADDTGRLLQQVGVNRGGKSMQRWHSCISLGECHSVVIVFLAHAQAMGLVVGFPMARRFSSDPHEGPVVARVQHRRGPNGSDAAIKGCGAEPGPGGTSCPTAGADPRLAERAHQVSLSVWGTRGSERAGHTRV